MNIKQTINKLTIAEMKEDEAVEDDSIPEAVVLFLSPVKDNMLTEKSLKTVLNNLP